MLTYPVLAAWREHLAREHLALSPSVKVSEL
jgi:hypothetical protein